MCKTFGEKCMWRVLPLGTLKPGHQYDPNDMTAEPGTLQYFNEMTFMIPSTFLRVMYDFEFTTFAYQSSMIFEITLSSNWTLIEAACMQTRFTWIRGHKDLMASWTHEFSNLMHRHTVYSMLSPSSSGFFSLWSIYRWGHSRVKVTYSSCKHVWNNFPQENIMSFRGFCLHAGTHP